jgi:hypothetical protein
MAQKLSVQLINFKTCIILLLVLSVSSLCTGQASSKKSITLTTDKWIPVLGQLNDERESFGYQLKEKDGGLEFSLTGYPGSPRSVRWTKEIEEINLGDYPYIIMSYEASWLNSPGAEVFGLAIQNDKGNTRDTTLLRMSDLIVDGKPHTLIVKNSKSGLARKMKVSLNTRSSRAYFFIKSMDLIKSENEFADCMEYDASESGGNTSMQCIDITRRYNIGFKELQKGLLKTNPVINDGGKYFSASMVNIDGIPFQVKPDGLNLLSFPAESKINDDTIVHFGVKVRRGLVAPVSRDDKIEVNVQSPASEVYFLLAAENPRTTPKDPKNQTYAVEDIETFAVELVYQDGTIDFAFPYSLRDKKHLIQGTFGAYVVPASGKPLEKIVFHDRTIGKDFYLGAVTVNKEQERLFPQLAEAPGPKPIQEPKIPEPAHVDPYMQYQNGMIRLGNSYVEMTIDARNGFTITHFNNKFFGDENIKLNPTPGFQVTFEENSVDPGEIKLLSVSDITGTNGKSMTLNYGLKDGEHNLGFKILVSVKDEPEIGMQMTAVNNSEKDLKAKVVFPMMNGIQMGDAEDVWYYYPSVRNVFSNKAGSFDHIYSNSFGLQFYDVYNPVLGGGFYLATRETDVNEMRRYGFRKNENGLMCYIEYPKVHTLLKSNVPDTLCKTVLGVHKGDWHAAFNTYRQWLRTWYKPYFSQDKQWYRECFWLLCEIPDNIPGDAAAIRQNFTWYDTLTKHYRMRDILEEHKRTVGRYPDILHFWSWTQNMPRGYSRWGAYGSNGEYERLGGVKNFRHAIEDIQKNMGLKVSLYFDASLCNRNLPIAKKIGPGAAMQKINGGPVIDYSSYRMCPGDKDWRDYMNGVYSRVNKDLGVNILYVDEWAAPFYMGHTPLPTFTCYSTEHDHMVPANMNLEVNTYWKELKTEGPKQATFYGEYPDVDINTRFYDSNINYYISDAFADLKSGRDNLAYDIEDKDNGLSRAFLNLYKFTFPGLVQLILPNGVVNLSWNRLKFTFLNGDAIYDSFWIRDESKAEAFMVKSHDLKLKYADCFTSNTPEPLVPTEQAGLIVNMYPGKGRTLWAMYNQGFNTVRGEVMKVRHVNGATYYDAWNDKPLQVRVSGDYAYISLEMYPQAVGCIIQSFNQ